MTEYTLTCKKCGKVCSLDECLSHRAKSGKGYNFIRHKCPECNTHYMTINREVGNTFYLGGCIAVKLLKKKGSRAFVEYLDQPKSVSKKGDQKWVSLNNLGLIAKNRTGKEGKVENDKNQHN